MPARMLTHGVVMLAVSLAGVFVAASTPAGAAATSPANGQGSTYAALAFQQWTQSVQNQGLNLNYTPTSSPAGLEAYSQNTADFAGTEAEFSELLPGSPVNVPRGFEYTPDVAGATAIMYNVASDPERAGPHQLAAPVADDHCQDLPGQDQQLGRPGDQRRQRRGDASQPAHHGGLPDGSIGNHGTLLRLRRPHRPRGLRIVGRTERLFDGHEDPRGRQRHLAHTTWRASRVRTPRPTTSPPTGGRSVTTNSATPRCTTTTSHGCRTPRATGCSPTQ